MRWTFLILCSKLLTIMLLAGVIFCFLAALICLFVKPKR